MLGNLALVYLLRGDPAAAREPALESLGYPDGREKRAALPRTLYLALLSFRRRRPGDRGCAPRRGRRDGPPRWSPSIAACREKIRHHLAISLGTEAFENRLGDGHTLKTPEQARPMSTTTSLSQTPSEPPGLRARPSGRERATGRPGGPVDKPTPRSPPQLYISVRTVHSHLDRIRDKSGCRRRADLTRLALEAGLVEGRRDCPVTAPASAITPPIFQASG